jgi:hypothetical protein
MPTPTRTEQARTLFRSLKSIRLMTGGMVKRATTRMIPTIWMRITTVSAMSDSSSTISARTGTPWTRAKTSSKATATKPLKKMARAARIETARARMT